jgi:hypothetical protein
MLHFGSNNNVESVERTIIMSLVCAIISAIISLRTNPLYTDQVRNSKKAMKGVKLGLEVYSRIFCLGVPRQGILVWVWLGTNPLRLIPLDMGLDILQILLMVLCSTSCMVLSSALGNLASMGTRIRIETYNFILYLYMYEITHPQWSSMKAW